MIDPEIARLRRLRSSALRARAIAAALDSDPVRRSPLLFRTALCCWRIARIITGRLRAHPSLSYRQGPSELRSAYDRVYAQCLSVIARYRGRGMQTLSDELQRVVRELNDARALTWSVDLSDTFGRSQAQLRKLIKELDTGARHERGSQHDTASGVEVGAGAGPDSAGNIARNWPYLGF